jgi:thiamine monophosphate synthase
VTPLSPSPSEPLTRPAPEPLSTDDSRADRDLPAPLPRLLVVADAASAPRPLPEIVAAAADHGARGFVLRARTLPPREQAGIEAALRAVLPPGCLLIRAGGPGPAVHLSATEPYPAIRPALVGRSCHHAADVDQAVNEECDYIFVSPVFETASKPGYGPALGPDGLAELCRRALPLRAPVRGPGVGLPVYALGGVLPERVSTCLHAGAYGVAVMGPVLRDPTIVAAYLAAVSEVTAS